MSVQTSVTQPGFAYPGLLVDVGFNNYVQSFVNADTTTIDFGLGVVRGNADRKALLPTSDSQEFLGVTVRDEMRENTFLNGVSGGSPYQIGEMMGVLTKQGKIWVIVEDAVIAGGAVYCRFLANGALTQLGAFRSNADTVSTVDHAFLIPNAQYYSSASAGGYAQILMPK